MNQNNRWEFAYAEKDIFLEDGLLNKSDVERLIKEFYGLNLDVLSLRQLDQYFAKWAAKWVNITNIDIDRAERCRYLANLLGTLAADKIDDSLSSWYGTIRERRQNRNSKLKALAADFFVVLYFEWFEELPIHEVIYLTDLVRAGIVSYKIGSMERHFILKGSRLSEILAFSETHRPNYCFDSINQFFRLLRDPGDLTSADVSRSSRLYPRSMPSGPRKRRTLHKYHGRPNSTIVTTSKEQILDVLSSSTVEVLPLTIGNDSRSIAISDIAANVASILFPLICTFIKRKQRPSKISLSKEKINLLAAISMRNFEILFAHYLFDKVGAAYSSELITEMSQLMNEAKLEKANSLEKPFAKLSTRYDAVVFRLLETVDSWDFVELTNDFLFDPPTDGRFNDLLDFLWFELQEALYRPMAIVFALESFARTNARPQLKWGSPIQPSNQIADMERHTIA